MGSENISRAADASSGVLDLGSSSDGPRATAGSRASRGEPPSVSGDAASVAGAVGAAAAVRFGARHRYASLPLLRRMRRGFVAGADCGDLGLWRRSPPGRQRALTCSVALAKRPGPACREAQRDPPG